MFGLENVSIRNQILRATQPRELDMWRGVKGGGGSVVKKNI